jgi:hypothetical protein
MAAVMAAALLRHRRGAVGDCAVAVTVVVTWPDRLARPTRDLLCGGSGFLDSGIS